MTIKRQAVFFALKEHIVNKKEKKNTEKNQILRLLKKQIVFIDNKNEMYLWNLYIFLA